jgi:hypothetical protein
VRQESTITPSPIIVFRKSLKWRGEMMKVASVERSGVLSGTSKPEEQPPEMDAVVRAMKTAVLRTLDASTHSVGARVVDVSVEEGVVPRSNYGRDTMLSLDNGGVP